MSSLVKLNKINSHLSEVVINRPEKLNAMTKPMWIELGKIFKKISKEKNLRCVIIRGEGGKSFSPGNDIGEFKKERSSSKLAKSYGKFLHGTLGSIFNCPVPTIAMIEGICVGGGLEIAACCDIRICGKSSRFGIPIKRLGLTMAAKELEVLLKATTYATAMEILFEGRVFNSQEALQHGLVSDVISDDKLIERALEIGSSYSSKTSAISVSLARQMMWNMLAATHPEEAHILDSIAMERMGKSQDIKEGIASFLEKRAPNFSMKVSKDLPDLSAAIKSK